MAREDRPGAGRWSVITSLRRPSSRGGRKRPALAQSRPAGCHTFVCAGVAISGHEVLDATYELGFILSKAMNPGSRLEPFSRGTPWSTATPRRRHGAWPTSGRESSQAARALVADGGWPAAQVDHVAARAGVATGTVYRHWSSKAELCAEIVATVSAREVGIVAAIAEADGTPAEKLQPPYAPSPAAPCSGRRLAYALIAEPVDPEVETVRLDYRAQLARCFERILREGIMRGAFPPARSRRRRGLHRRRLHGSAGRAAGAEPKAPGRAPTAISSTRSPNSACAPASAPGRPSHDANDPDRAARSLRPPARRCRPTTMPRTR